MTLENWLHDYYHHRNGINRMNCHECGGVKWSTTKK